MAAAVSPWIIEPGRVGALVLGQPMPAALLTDQLADRYAASYVADGVAADSFRFDDPPLTVYLADGPFARLDRVASGGAPPTDQLRAAAAVAARGGARVTMIMIHGAGPVTAAGLGVGADLVALRAAYPDLRLYPRPPTRGDDGDDQCVARPRSQPGMGFVFATCARAEAGEPSRRIDLWIPE